MAVSVVLAVDTVADSLVQQDPGADPEHQGRSGLRARRRDGAARDQGAPRQGRLVPRGPGRRGARSLVDGRDRRPRRRLLHPAEPDRQREAGHALLRRRDLRTGALGRPRRVLRRGPAAHQRQPVRQRHGAVHPRRWRGPAVPVRRQRRHGRHQRAGAGAGELLQLRWMEGVVCSATSTCTAPRASTSTRAARSSRRAGPTRAPRRSTSASPRTGRATMEFGVVLQTNPPASRVVELARQAENYGFDYVWTFDSHILWEEPYVIYSAILAATRKVDRRTDGHQPGDPRLDRDRLGVRHAQRDVRQSHGVRHRPRRLGRSGHERQAGDGEGARRFDPRDPRARQRPRGRLQGFDPAIPVGRRAAVCEVWVAAYGPKVLALAGAAGRRVHPAARRSEHRRRGRSQAVRTAAEAAGRNPADVKICVAAPAYVTDGTEAGLAHGREQCRWFGGMVGNHVADLVARYGDRRRRRAPGPDRLHQGPRGLRLQRARPGREHPRQLRPRRDRRSVLHRRATRGARRPAAGAARRSVSTSSRSTSNTTPRSRRCWRMPNRSCPRSPRPVRAKA